MGLVLDSLQAMICAALIWFLSSSVFFFSVFSTTSSLRYRGGLDLVVTST
jgi:hypothetical protein